MSVFKCSSNFPVCCWTFSPASASYLAFKYPGPGWSKCCPVVCPRPRRRRCSNSGSGCQSIEALFRCRHLSSRRSSVSSFWGRIGSRELSPARRSSVGQIVPWCGTSEVVITSKASSEKRCTAILWRECTAIWIYCHVMQWRNVTNFSAR